MSMKSALYGCDVLGADAPSDGGGIGSTIASWFSSKPTYVMAFTDKGTVTNVQQAIVDFRAMTGGSAPTELNLGTSGPKRNGVDGSLGPRTSAAVNYVNTVYGADPDAGPNITAKTLARLSAAVGRTVEAAASPVRVDLGTSSAPPKSTPSPSGPPTSSVPGTTLPPGPSVPAAASEIPTWQIAGVAVLGVTGIAAIIYGLVGGRD